MAIIFSKDHIQPTSLPPSPHSSTSSSFSSPSMVSELSNDPSIDQDLAQHIRNVYAHMERVSVPGGCQLVRFFQSAPTKRVISLDPLTFYPLLAEPTEPESITRSVSSSLTVTDDKLLRKQESLMRKKEFSRIEKWTRIPLGDRRDLEPSMATSYFTSNTVEGKWEFYHVS
ncbi:hypothetical protein BY996DRAFT_6605949 [Phakopsora pachyrhizi]|nr:hypothetical protein BY996DRAFT_6605949 [Phakopsora pachyrhizi]